MKCTFCAEDIQPEAVICRFCGALKIDGEWRMSTATQARRAPRPPAGTFTLRFAGAAFGLSAVLELVSITTAVPLFGKLHGGIVAVAYHGVYVALYVALFVGLWQLRRWAYPALFAATCLYTVDNVRFALDPAGIRAKYAAELTAFQGMVDETMIVRTATVSALLFVACWWGFVLWVHRYRDALAG